VDGGLPAGEVDGLDAPAGVFAQDGGDAAPGNGKGLIGFHPMVFGAEETAFGAMVGKMELQALHPLALGSNPGLSLGRKPHLRLLGGAGDKAGWALHASGARVGGGAADQGTFFDAFRDPATFPVFRLDLAGFGITFAGGLGIVLAIRRFHQVQPVLFGVQLTGGGDVDTAGRVGLAGQLRHFFGEVFLGHAAGGEQGETEPELHKPSTFGLSRMALWGSPGNGGGCAQGLRQIGEQEVGRL